MQFAVELWPRAPAADIAFHARCAEYCGFSRLWVRDMLSVPWELWTAVSTCLDATERIRVGVDVTNPYSRSPLVNAHAAATLHETSRGRLDLGLGRGIAGLLSRMGYAMHNEALGDCLAAIRRLLRGESVTLESAAFRLQEARLPLAAGAAGLPIYLAAMEEEVFHLAAEQADGALTISSNPALLRKALLWLGKDGRVRPLSTWLPYSLSREALEAKMGNLLTRLPPQLLELMEIDPAHGSNEALLHQCTICGLDELAQRSAELEALGVQEIILEYHELDDLRGMREFIAGHAS